MLPSDVDAVSAVDEAAVVVCCCGFFMLLLPMLSVLFEVCC
jgi:hypothetical protein